MPRLWAWLLLIVALSVNCPAGARPLGPWSCERLYCAHLKHGALEGRQARTLLSEHTGPSSEACISLTAREERHPLRVSVRKAAHCDLADGLRTQQANLQYREWESLATTDAAYADDVDYGEPDEQPRSSQQVAAAAVQQSPVQPQQHQTPAQPQHTSDSPEQTNLSQASQLALLLASRNAARLARAAAA